jgi:hypothetical protein
MHHAVQSVGTAVVPVDQDSLHTATKNDVSKTSTVDYEPLAFVGKSKEVSQALHHSQSVSAALVSFISIT